jgi:hypothetical protein
MRAFWISAHRDISAEGTLARAACAEVATRRKTKRPEELASTPPAKNAKQDPATSRNVVMRKF